MQDWIRGKQQNFEDQLTSCVFGPLRYMEPDAAWEACLMVLGDSGRAQKRDSIPSCVYVRFWPHFQRHDGEGRFVEPDVHIVAWDGNRLFATILVETKWNSRLGPNQLIDQWRFITTDDNNSAEVRSRSRHVLLSKYPLHHADSIAKQKEAARNEGMEWGDRLIVLTWYQLAAQLAELRDFDGPLEVWRRDLLSLLSRLGIIPFEGFQWNRFKSVDIVQWQFEPYAVPDLLEVGAVNWSFDGGLAA